MWLKTSRRRVAVNATEDCAEELSVKDAFGDEEEDDEEGGRV